MPVASVVEFVSALEASHLLTEEAFARVRADAEQGGGGPEGLAKRLVREKLLTRWQAGMLLAGRTAFFLGKYKLLAELGRGGMGAVFQAEQVPLGRIVALKVMAQKLVRDPAAVARFHREIQAAAALTHPNVVAALDADQVQKTHFLVMEFVEGESLDAILKREKTLPVGMACEYIRQAALGLQAAHERRMAHRDIKPGNLLVTRGGKSQAEAEERVAPPPRPSPTGGEGEVVVKILDFGLARFTSEAREEGELTQTGQVMGTPDYIAPEQARSTKDADIRSDIFSLGCTLYRALAGRLPYGGLNVMEKLMSRATTDAPRVRTLRAEVPAELDDVVAKMLARDPEKRYQTPGEVAEALARFSGEEMKNEKWRMENAKWGEGAGKPQAAGTAGVHGDEGDLVRVDAGLNQFLVDLANEAEGDEEAGETVATKSAMPAGSDTQMRMQTAAPAGSQPRKRAGRKLTANLEAQAKADRRTLIVGGIGAAVVVLASLGGWLWHRAGATRLVVEWPEEERQKAILEVDGLKRMVPEAGGIAVLEGRPGRRRIVMSRAGYKDVEMEVEFTRGETKTVRPEWEPTAGTLRKQDLAGFRAATDNLRKKFGGKLPPGDDSEARRLVENFKELRRRFLGTGDLKGLEAAWRTLPASVDGLSAETIPERDRTIAGMASESGALASEVVAIWGDSRLKTPGGVYQLAVHPEGRLAATMGTTGTTCVWDLETGLPWMKPLNLTGAIRRLAFSPDGKRLAISEKEIEIWSVAEKRLETTVPIPLESKQLRGLEFVPGTNWLAMGSEGPDVFVWDLEAKAMHATLRLGEGETMVTSVATSADGKWLAAGGHLGTVQVWDLKTGESRNFPKHTADVISVAFRRDSRVLASGGGFFARLWDVEKGEMIREFDAGAGYGIHTLSWNSDGTLLAANSGDAHVNLWNPDSGMLVRSVGEGEKSNRYEMNALGHFTADDRLVIATGEGELNILDGKTWEKKWDIGRMFSCAAMDPLGEWIAVGTQDSTIELRDLGTGNVIRKWDCEGVPWSLAVSPDRKQMAMAFWYGGPAPRVFDLDRAGEPRELAGLPNVVRVAFTPDGKWVLGVSHFNGFAGWSTTDLKEKFKTELPQGYYHSVVAVASDGKHAVVGGTLGNNSEYSVVSLPDGKLTRGEKIIPISAAVGLPDARYALVGSATANTYRVDLATGKVKDVSGALVPVHGRGWTSFSLMPDGSNVAGAALDGRIRFVPVDRLDIEREIFLGSFMNSANQVLATPEGRHVVLVMENGTVWVVRIGEGR